MRGVNHLILAGHDLERIPKARQREAAIVDAANRALRHYRLLDRQLAGRDFLLGAQMTLADIPVGVTLHRYFAALDEGGLARPALPGVEAWHRRLQGFGLGFLFVPIATVAFATLSPQLRTDGAAIFNLVRGLGSSIGISIVFTLLTSNGQVHYAALSAEISPFNAALRQVRNPAWSLDTASGLARLQEEITRQSTMLAYLDDFRFLMVLVLLSFFALLLVRVRSRSA